jgi:hypothetical protein
MCLIFEYIKFIYNIKMMSFTYNLFVFNASYLVLFYIISESSITKIHPS